VVKGMKEKKAENIVVINLTNKKNAVADYFVICNGNSDTHVDAIANSIEEVVHKGIQQWPWHIEGRSVREWILLDYVSVVVHVFLKERRSFYGIEELWGDAEITRIED
jgi:ribosome-associated protein